MQQERWREVADGVLVRRHAHLDVNVVLVVGDGGCLVVDTRCSQVEGRDLAGAVRRVTSAPWTVVLTHAHHDHCFGTAALLPTTVWAHQRCGAELAAHGEALRERTAAQSEAAGRPDLAGEVRDSPLVLPDRLVTGTQALDVGGRRVVLHAPGRGHTDGDLVVHLPDDGVVLAGDLVEEGAPPQFDDAFPLDWPGTLDRLLALGPSVVVPGHGDVVDAAFVAAQRDLLADVARRSTAGAASGTPVAEVARTLPALGAFAEAAVARAYAQLAAAPAGEGLR